MENRYNITKPSIQRLSKLAGVKSMSLNCQNIIKLLLLLESEQLIDTIILYNKQHATKTIMVNDIYNAIEHFGCKISKSNNLGNNICSIK